MITVTLPVKNNVSPVLVIMVTEGCPNWRMTSARGVPIGIMRPDPAITGMNGVGVSGGNTGFVGTNAVGDGLTKGNGMIVVPGRIT